MGARMAWLRTILDRLSRLGGRFQPLIAGLALLALFFSLRTIEQWSRPVVPDEPGRAVATPFLVENPEGERIGTLVIEYPRRLRQNQDARVTVRYEGAYGPWGGGWAEAAGNDAL